MILYISNLLYRYRKITFSVLFMFVAVSLILIGKGSFSSNIFDILPLEDKIVAKHFHFLTLFDTIDRIVFEISSTDPSKNFNQLANETRTVIQTLKKSDLFIIQDDLKSNDFFKLRNLVITNQPNLFSHKDSLWLSKCLNFDSLYKRLDRTVSELFTLSSGNSDAFLLQHDPFNLAQSALAKLAAFKPVEDVFINEEFITNKANNRILFFALSKKSGMEESNAGEIYKILETLQKSLPERGFNLTWMGALRASKDNSDIIKQDVHFTIPITITLINIICFFIYRRFHYSLLTFLPTLLGIVFVFALFSHFSRLSIIILGFGAALLGITVDYAIHYLYHIDDVPDDKNPVKTLTGPIFASAFTTACAFLVLGIAKIPGLTQLGVVTASGIVIIAILSLTILPLFSNTDNKKTIHKPKIKPVEWFNLFYCNGYDKKLTIPVLLITVFLLIFIKGLSFDGNPNNLNGMKRSTIAAEETIYKNWSGVQSGTYLVVTDKSFKAVLNKAHKQLIPLVDTLYSKGLINPVTVFTLILPPENVQSINRIRWLNTFTQDKIGLMHKSVDSIATKYGIDPSPFHSYIADITKDDLPEYITLNSYPASIKNNLLKNFIRCDDSLWYANVPVFPPEQSNWTKIDSLAQEKGVLAVNDAVLGLRVVEIIKTGFFRCLIFIPIAIFIVLLIMLRNVIYAASALILSFAATGITLGTMVLLNIPVNLVSLIIFAFIFGLGIDYTLLMLYMSRKGIAENKPYLQAHAAASVTIAACTTLAGLGILTFARHPVLSVMGKTGTIGIISSYMCATVLVPVILRLKIKK